MGIEYANLDRSSDQDVDIVEPESLLYMPEGIGGPAREGAGRRLVAVVYRVPVLDHTQEPPELFDRSFEGPVPGSTAGLPEYRLRVWLFSPNPGGPFSAANPAEACVGAGLVAPHAFEEGLHEVVGVFSVDAAKVREVLGVPPELRLQGESADGSGLAQLIVSVRSLRWSSGEQPTEPTLLGGPFVLLQPPDWAGEATNPGHNTDYFFSLLSDNTELVEWMQRGMDVGLDVIAYSDDIELDFAPALGLTGPYRFSSPTFVTEGFVTDPVPANTTWSWRAWHKGPQGMGLFRGWHDDGQLGAADITVTPAPGTPLAELLGCGPDSDGCDPVRPDVSVAFVADGRSPWLVDVVRDWWNPRLQRTDDGILAFPQGSS